MTGHLTPARRSPVRRPDRCAHGHSLARRSSILVWQTGGRTRWACKRCREARHAPLHPRSARSGGRWYEAVAGILGPYGALAYSRAYASHRAQSSVV